LLINFSARGLYRAHSIAIAQWHRDSKKALRINVHSLDRNADLSRERSAHAVEFARRICSAFLRGKPLSHLGTPNYR